MSLPKPYYAEAGITIYHGDCRDILPHLPKVDLVLTDPPYGIAYNSDGQSKHQESHRGNTDLVFGDDKPFDPKPFLKWPAILWGANCYSSKLPDKPAWLAWDKVLKNGLGVRIGEMELAWANCISRAVVFRHLWSGAYRESEAGQYLHPTQKPIALMAWCLTRPGVPHGLVLDPFMGSGTTLVAAKNLGRKAIGIEIEEKYCAIAVDRLRQGILLTGAE